MKLKIGDYVELEDKSVFVIDSVNKKSVNYPFEGTCVESVDADYWVVGDFSSWTQEGYYQNKNSLSNLNINRVLKREEHPEYYL